MLSANVLLVCCLCVSQIWAWAHATGEELETSIAQEGLTLVAFVDPGKPRSQSLENNWLTATSDAPGGTLLSINCEAETTVCKEYAQNHAINSYPHIELFENKAPKGRYLGSHSASAIAKFVARMSRPALTELDLESRDAFEAADDAVFIAYISAEDAMSREIFSAVSAKYRLEFTFGVVANIAATKARYKETPHVSSHVTEADGVKTDSSMEINNQSELDIGLDSWVAGTRLQIAELTRQNEKRLLDRGWPMVYIFAETEADRDEIRGDLHDFAKSHCSEYLTCVTVDHLEFPDLQAKLGLQPGAFPAGAVHQLSKDNIYHYPRGLAIDSRSLQKWGWDVYQGQIKPWTPPGANKPEGDGGLVSGVKRKFSMAKIPGVTIRVAGHEEL